MAEIQPLVVNVTQTFQKGFPKQYFQHSQFSFLVNYSKMDENFLFVTCIQDTRMHTNLKVYY